MGNGLNMHERRAVNFLDRAIIFSRGPALFLLLGRRAVIFLLEFCVLVAILTFQIHQKLGAHLVL